MAATIGSDSPTPSNASPAQNFDALFAAYAKFGDTRSDGRQITLSNSDKWMRAAGVIPSSIKAKAEKEPLTFTTTSTGIEYKKIAKVRKAIDKAEYDQFLLLLLKSSEPDESKRSKLLIQLKEKMIKAGPPKLNTSSGSSSAGSRPGTAASSGASKVDSVVARLTDHTKYTGSHKLRFDEEGKGKGKAGRV